MSRTLPVLAALLLVALPNDGWAQARDHILPVSASRLSGSGAQIFGTVVDEAGAGISGASVLAVGATLAVARSDERGRFSFQLPAGRYVLRVARDGYVSTYREAVQVRAADEPIRRNISLTHAPGPALMLASTGAFDTKAAAGDAPTAPVTTADPLPEPAQSETAWRLRHLPRTVLRDGTDAGEWIGPSSEVRLPEPARAASFLSDTDFTGHIDFLTTRSVAVSGPPSSTMQLPHGVAYVVVGAPVRDRGDWSVRAAWTAGDAASWTLLGEYRARPDRVHAFVAGVSYSAQVLSSDPAEPLVGAPPGVRRVGGAYFSDRWAATRGVELDYGLKLDRYDYLVAPNLASGQLGLRVAVAPRTTLVTRVSPHMIAPGADEFLPPVAAGVWLPPERTFSSLAVGGALRPERVNQFDVIVETRLARQNAPVLRLGRFVEMTTDQIATLFGLDESSGAGHYSISSPGSVRVDGWTVGVAGPLTKYVQGTVDYRATRAAWTDIARLSGREGRLALPVAREGSEAGHDLTTSIEARVPGTDTHLNLAYRVNTAFSVPSQRQPVTASRFKVEVRQQLPFRPLPGSELHVLVSAGTLLHDLGDGGAYFDELLTVEPPLRVTCGLQMRF